MTVPAGAAKGVYTGRAVRDAIREEMRCDDRVVLLGEDVEVGVHGTTVGLRDEFGPTRVHNTPISEAILGGIGIGLSFTGWRPVIDLLYSGFVYLAFDQIVNHAAKFRYKTGGQVSLPITYLTVGGGGHMGGVQQSDNAHGFLSHAPGIKVVMPSGPREARALLPAVLRDDNPVFVLLDSHTLRMREEVPEDITVAPLGKSYVRRRGTDVTVVAIGSMVAIALAVAAEMEKEGIQVEVIDPRTIVPLDVETILASVQRTGRLVVADDAFPYGGPSAEIVAALAEHDVSALRSVRRLTRPNAHVPFNRNLERSVLPSQIGLLSAIRMAVG